MIIDGCVNFQVEKNKYKCVFNVIIISRMPSIRCVSVEGPHGYVTFYVNLMVFFLNGYVHVRSMQVRWHVHPFIRGSIYLFFNDSTFLV